MFRLLCRLLLQGLVLLSMAYTTLFLLLCPFQRSCPSRLSLHHLLPSSSPSTPAVNISTELTHWGPNRTPLAANLFLSAAFAQAQQPLRIAPYHHRARRTPSEHDVTLCTLITPERLPLLARLAAHYNGPMSVSLHVSAAPAQAATQLASLATALKDSSALRKHADIHVLRSAFPRALNAQRNAARLLARSQLVLMLDADFVPSPSFFPSKLHYTLPRDLEAGVLNGTAALVLPAFEYVNQSDGMDAARFPHTKDALVKEVEAGRMAMFHASWAPGHNCTDYARWLSLPPSSSTPWWFGAIYKVKTYSAAYEPYVVLARDAPGGWCDERFEGYGGNKAACLFDLRLSGAEMYVLSWDFVVHTAHAYAERARRAERKQNRRVYAEFREEACLKIVRSLGAQGLLETKKRAAHALEECGKLRGIRPLLSQLQTAHAPSP